jgi:hypothetical protein
MQDDRKERASANWGRYFSNPKLFVQEIVGIPEEDIEPEQHQILDAVANEPMVAVKSGHGIGKTATLSWVILWFIMTRPNARIPCTAPTQHQLYDILWAEVSKWIGKCKIAQQILQWTATKVYVKGKEKTWFAVARASNKPENLAGFHEDHILFIVEEASGVPQPIMEVVEAALTNEGAKMLMVGNPTLLSGTFYNAFHKDRNIYKTLTFNAENSRRVSELFLKRMARYGKDSNVYRVRVKGEFPKGQPDTLITLEQAEQAVGRKVEPWNKHAMGVDPARYGDDESVIYSREGNRILPAQAFHGINTTQLTGMVLKRAREVYKVYKEPLHIKVDDTGVGAGVTDQLEEAQSQEKVKPLERKEFNIKVIPIVNNGKPNSSEYADRGTEMWGTMRDALDELSLPADDDDLIAQMATRKYKVQPDGKLKLERKDDMKKRNLPSPDRADALALCLAEGKVWDFGDRKIGGEKRGD